MRSSFLLLAAALIALSTAQAQINPNPGELQIRSRDARGVPTLVSGRLGQLTVGRPELTAAGFATRFAAEALGGLGSETFTATRVRTDDLGLTHVRLQQSLNGLPVVGAELVVHLDSRSRVVEGVNGRFVPDPRLAATPGMDAAGALRMAFADAGILAAEILDEPELTYVFDPRDQTTHLAWSAHVRYADELGFEIDRIFADALTGGLVTSHPQIFRALHRQTLSAKYGADFSDLVSCISDGGALFIPEDGDSPPSSETNCEGAEEAHFNAAQFYAYFAWAHGRDSIDDAGQTLRSLINAGGLWADNAAWDTGPDHAIFGSGGAVFGRLSDSIDVVVHEFTHAITDFESGLVYRDESGALNESLSDVFAAAADALINGNRPENWWIAEDVYTPGSAGDALRYMNDPTRDGESRDFYPDRYVGSGDRGGVHWNSGISNLAFKLLSDGGVHPRDKTHRWVEAIGVRAAEKIFYRTATVYLTSSSQFADMRESTIQAAADLYGATSDERKSTRDAWCAVGVSDVDCPTDLWVEPGTFFGIPVVFINWQFAEAERLEVFVDGDHLNTVDNGGWTLVAASQGGGATGHFYWVCDQGVLSWDEELCSNIAFLLS